MGSSLYASAHDPVRDTADWLIVRNGALELGFSKTNGQLGYVADARSGEILMGSRADAFRSLDVPQIRVPAAAGPEK